MTVSERIPAADSGAIVPDRWDDDDTPYRMPAFSGRNILVFSDGTGQAGGVEVDEFRSNVYKLFRATRCGPDTIIDPDHQLAFYDPGLGSKLAGDDIKVPVMRRVYNGLSSVTGLGITGNLVDCYAALMRLWRPGDRIFLFGFSRGAYTVRCLAGVLGLCGIPTRMPDGSPLLRDPDTLKAVATEAVKRVYRHGSGAADRDEDNATDRTRSLKAQRAVLGDQFRQRYASEEAGVSNAVPHFIGVWDTVAAIGVSSSLVPWLWTAAAVIVCGLSALLAWFLTRYDFVFWMTWVETVAAVGFAGLASYYLLRLKVSFGVPGFKWWQTVHLTNVQMKFFDRHLNPQVRYARHALSLDERRADFDRVPWANDADPPNREVEEGAYLRQLWFAGNHSDVGGSYPENESRLSDIALKWMANQAKKAGLLVNENLLSTYGRHTGQQHDECRTGVRLLFWRLKWKEKARKIVPKATYHPSVMRRFKETRVLVYDKEQPYRPDLLAGHVDFKDVYAAETSPPQTATS
ncbi:DUF2235 domain-containing protein [Tardiphaga sp.]|uniref:DUF2235 domain-containing protein n=1 Tax=Tardiphaga sp. TaxID=1926292 RepID=UPI00267F9945